MVKKSATVRKVAAERGLEVVDMPVSKVAFSDLMGLPETEMVERTTIFGNKFMEAKDTPFYCSPRSETYWCS